MSEKIFFITYKGLMFEGEKYLEATADSFDITRIHMQMDQHSLKGFRYEDFHFFRRRNSNPLSKSFNRMVKTS